MRKKNLLVVADDWEALERYEDQLQAHFHVTGAPFGSEGVRLAAEHSPEEPYDEILLDLTLEDMTPEEGVQALRALGREIPLLVILSPDEPASFADTPGIRILRRPYEYAELLRMLQF